MSDLVDLKQVIGILESAKMIDYIGRCIWFLIGLGVLLIFITVVLLNGAGIYYHNGCER